MDKNNEGHNYPSFNDPINWKSLGFFSSEEYILYIFKKTEKITAALYIVSGLLKDDEPLKWELRDHGMDLLSSSFSASSALPGDKNIIIQSLFTAALETMSLLNVGRISNLISDMNHGILIRELDNIIGLLRDRLAQNAENAGYVLSENFFKTPGLFATGFKPSERTNQSSGHQSRPASPGSADVKYALKSNSPKGQSEMNGKKTDRQNMILDLLKGQSNLTIKDFSKVIQGCSEKTIQRELLDLVDRGLVRKDGERRWSTYSLK